MFLVADAYALGAASRITSVCLGCHDSFVACMRIVYAFTGVRLVGGAYAIGLICCTFAPQEVVVCAEFFRYAPVAFRGEVSGKRGGCAFPGSGVWGFAYAGGGTRALPNRCSFQLYSCKSW